MLLHEAAGQALDGIAAGLAAPLARGDVGLDLLARQVLEAHARVDDLDAHAVVRRDQAERRQHAMRAPRQQLQATPAPPRRCAASSGCAGRRRRRCRRPARRRRRCPCRWRSGRAPSRPWCGRARVTSARGISPRSALLVDRGRAQRVGLDAHLRQQRQAPRAGTGQHQPWPFHFALLAGTFARQRPAQRLPARRGATDKGRQQPGLEQGLHEPPFGAWALKAGQC